MEQVVCCDICGKPWRIGSNCYPTFPFKDSDGNEFDLIICHNCREDDKVVRCFGCDCYLRPEDAFSFDKADYYENYCRQCVEQAIEDKLQEIEDIKKEIKLVDAKKAFEHRKTKRE